MPPILVFIVITLTEMHEARIGSKVKIRVGSKLWVGVITGTVDDDFIVSVGDEKYQKSKYEVCRQTGYKTNVVPEPIFEGDIICWNRGYIPNFENKYTYDLTVYAEVYATKDGWRHRSIGKTFMGGWSAGRLPFQDDKAKTSRTRVCGNVILEVYPVKLKKVIDSEIEDFY